MKKKLSQIINYVICQNYFAFSAVSYLKNWGKNCSSNLFDQLWKISISTVNILNLVVSYIFASFGNLADIHSFGSTNSCAILVHQR